MELELRGITKRFPGVVANDDVNLTVRSGEILGLLGENGAGKTTLMNILYGLYGADEGEILIDGTPVDFSGPNDAIAAGIGMVHQHFMLVPVMTVSENVVLAVEPTKRRLPLFAIVAAAGALLAALTILFGLFETETMGWGVVVSLLAVAGTGWYLSKDTIDAAEAEREVAEISKQYRLAVDPHAVIEDLPVGTQQRVEIIKVLFRDAEILVFDEPTAVLTPQEVEEFFGILRSLKAAGKGIVFITHKLGEIKEIADRAAVLRRGKVVGEADPRTATKEDLASMMVGRPVALVVEKGPADPGEVVLSVEDLVVVDDRDHVAVDHVSFEVRRGEIVGVAGVQGNGQTELVEALTGLRSIVSGTVKLLGKEVTTATPRQLHEARVAHVPEDRQRSGLILDFTVAENMVLDAYYDEPFSAGIRMRWSEAAKAAEALVEQYDVRTPGVTVTAGSLSGGNQQKVIVAREFSRDVDLVIASQPTRGIDVGSIEYIHERIVEERDEGVALLIVSTELDEVTALSDRILVMYEGRIVAETTPEESDHARLGLFMAGESDE